MTQALNTINGFTITDRAFNGTLNLKLSDYRDSLAKLSNPEYADSEEHLRKEVSRLEKMLLTGKALTR